MSQGYWARTYWQGCPCCLSGPKEKFYCQPCDHVCKAPIGWDPHCPYCRAPMLNMGHRWRPGKRGKRTLEHSNQVRMEYLSAGETLLRMWNEQRAAAGSPAARARAQRRAAW